LDRTYRVANRKRDESFMIKLDPREKEAIKKRAESMGMTMSAYARFILLQDVRVEE